MILTPQRRPAWILAAILLGGLSASAQPQPAAPKPAPAKPAPAKPAPAKANTKAASAKAPAAGGTQEFFLHAFHAKDLGLDCSTCHVPEKEGSVVLKRPGHEQCMVCHSDDFGANLNQKVCAQCHSVFPPSGGEDVLPFPRYQKTRAILFEFSHNKHVDPQGRLNAKTGFRADCTFCHTFEPTGAFATFPGHTQCTACHSKPGMHPSLSATSTTADCRGCHTPEEIENPGFTEQRRLIAPHVVSGTLVNIKFTHIEHFKEKDQYNLNCTTCHYAIPQSTSLQNLTLPKMIDCVQCHDSDKTIPTEFRMTNCSTCHINPTQGQAPASHTRYIKPPFHTEVFRTNHSAEANEPGAKCFVCHTNVQQSTTLRATSSSANINCVGCHQVMKPASHSSRWKEDLHGQYASIDRQTCAMCHTADYCIRCHNEEPSSHEPLALFRAGAHARPALLNERSCLTCHTYQNTCSECHLSKVQ
jgi:hypothetical protein